jgi:hypothetical protein
MAAPEDAILVFMDGDGSDRVDYIERLVAPILGGTQDFVIASRVRGVSEPGSMGWHQLFIGVVIGALIWMRFGFRYTDMCAFRALRREQLLALDMREMTYGWNLEMQMKAVRERLRVLEIPVPYTKAPRWLLQGLRQSAWHHSRERPAPGDFYTAGRQLLCTQRACLNCPSLRVSTRARR